ncbi:MAG: ChpI protein [Syntrophus sp. (in: bacteria)]|nr:ChpI protein [Syntrophus sp. (in: bacteria)]
MKTAISIPDELFLEIEKVAKDQKRSRSAIFTLATKEYLERIKSKTILDSLNEVYSGKEEPGEIEARKDALRHFGRHVVKDPY